MMLQTVVNGLYREALLIAMILLGIMLYNNLVLYRQKISDRVSLMLLFGVAICAFEILWAYCSGHPSLRVLTYLGGCGYVLSFLLLMIQLNAYVQERFERLPQRNWKNMAFHYAPIAVFGLICVTTPWTRWLIWVDESGTLQEMTLFSFLFTPLLWIYFLAALVRSIYSIVRNKKTDRSALRTARAMIVFCVLTPAIFVLEMCLLGSDSDYLALSLAVAVALVYLTVNVSTQALLETQAQVEAVESDLRIAAKIQSDALPPVAPEFADHLDLNLYASMNTAREVGGDFYDYFTIDENHICFLIADVSGKGTSAALFMMTAKTMIKDYALIRGSTEEIFTDVNARLSENNKAGMFATAWIGILDTRTMTLQYTNAGHNCPVLQRQGEPSQPIKKLHGLFLAGMEDTVYRSSELQMKPGDRLLLYTDGVTEAHAKGGGLYGTQRLFAVVDANAGESNKALLEAVISDVNDFAAGVPQFDDITMMALSIKP